MLKEFAENIPINLNFSAEDFQKILTRDFIILIYENCGADLTRSANSLTSVEIEKIILTTGEIYKKILANKYLSEEQKIFVANSLLCRIFELWKISTAPELFFIKLQNIFTPAEIVGAFLIYMNSIENFNWIAKFFIEHKNIFKTSNKKIQTIFVYGTSASKGGLAKYVSMIVSKYLQMGYRVIFLTDKSDSEYPPPGYYENSLIKIVFEEKNLYNRIKKLEVHLNEYKPELFIGNMQWDSFSSDMQILFFKLSGVKVVMQFHEALELHALRYTALKTYRLADALIVLSHEFEKFWKNFGVRSYYIQNPIFTGETKNFYGRNPKENSKTILWVGNIAVHKNTFAALQILNEIVKKIPDVKLRILGNVSEQALLNQMKSFIATNHLEEKVEFCGHHKEVENFYKSADVMLVTSPLEGFGLAIAESKFYELPLVLYKLERNELLRDGKGYIAVEQGDFHGAAQAIIKILTNTELRCRLSEEARESIQPFLDYDIEGAWQRVFEDLENNVSIPPHDLLAESVQEFFVNELWQKNIQINNLLQRIKNLEGKFQ